MLKRVLKKRITTTTLIDKAYSIKEKSRHILKILNYMHVRNSANKPCCMKSRECKIATTVFFLSYSYSVYICSGKARNFKICLMCFSQFYADIYSLRFVKNQQYIPNTLDHVERFRVSYCYIIAQVQNTR